MLQIVQLIATTFSAELPTEIPTVIHRLVPAAASTFEFFPQLTKHYR
jgi:hypothetical protein